MVPLEDIYEAAFDRTLFEPLLHRIIMALGGDSGFLAWSDLKRQAKFEVQVGNDPAWLQQYVETYWEYDLLRPILYLVPEGEPSPAWPHLQMPEIQQSRFYREYLAPQGIIDNLAVNLIMQPDMVASLAIIRKAPAPPFAPADIASLKALVPHLRRTILLQSQIIANANLVHGYQEAAKSTRDGLILLDQYLTVLDVDADLAALSGVQIAEPLRRTRLGCAVADTVADGQPRLLEMTSADGAAVRLLCHAQPVARDLYGDLVAGPRVAFAVHVTQVDRPWPIAFPTIAALYGLTPTELRVAQDALAHGDITALGERLGMARTTTRTHLHRIYEKTGTSGFADFCLFAHRFILPRPLPAEA